MVAVVNTVRPERPKITEPRATPWVQESPEGFCPVEADYRRTEMFGATIVRPTVCMKL